ncbi:MAG TPA: hypothetical protein VKS25_14150 [Solirubrobacteraceae bacterium]|nr:hypothetical protein [Solirubrobacteraceae bacterium]
MRRGWVIAAAALAAAALASPSSGAVAGSCGSATSSVLEAVDGQVVSNVYANELAGREVTQDVAQIASAPDLLAAVAADAPRATFKVVQRIVYHHGWHIVRLRVLDASGKLLADFGGPFVVAPVRGVLRSASGAQIGSFVMSVQDDAGIAKLENRFVGDAVGVYFHAHPVVEVGGVFFPRSMPRGTSLTVRGVRYAVQKLTYDAFPTGTLTMVLLVSPASSALAAQTCATVRADEIGRVAQRLTSLLGPIAQHYYGYTYWVHLYTGAAVYVRNPDGSQIASSDGTDPDGLPLAGPATVNGQSFLVVSFEPKPPVRVYLLVSAS